MLDLVPLVDRDARVLVPMRPSHRGLLQWREFPESGGLMSYGPSDDPGKRMAAYVDNILKGAKPADLPFEQPTRFELVINMRTARTLGLAIPQSLLLRGEIVR